MQTFLSHLLHAKYKILVHRDQNTMELLYKDHFKRYVIQHKASSVILIQVERNAALTDQSNLCHISSVLRKYLLSGTISVLRINGLYRKVVLYYVNSWFWIQHGRILCTYSATTSAANQVINYSTKLFNFTQTLLTSHKTWSYVWPKNLLIQHNMTKKKFLEIHLRV